MKKNLKIMVMLCVLLSVSMIQIKHSQAAISVGIIEIIKQAVIKVIKAIDLKMQRLQNNTIWLQNAQKTLENTLSKLKLEEISDWQQKQKEQYRKYYDELTRVKSTISAYQRIRDVAQRQFRMVDEYNRTWGLLKQDDHFTREEIDYMAKVYNGILQESLKNINQISQVLLSFSTKISDGKRLEVINNAADQVERNFIDLRKFTEQNVMLSIQRARDEQDVKSLKRLYGLD